MVAEGAMLAGKYRVLNKLGEGGMGAVFRAENVLTGKQVAIKCLAPELSEEPEAGARLLREARMLSRFNHPNVVDVYDVLFDEGGLFLVLELLRGETLEAYVQGRNRLRISELITLLLPAMAAVDAAHRHGVLHRDLKPSNIFVEMRDARAAPVAKVLDFGVAKLMVASVQVSQAATPHPTLTQPGAALGTPLYMSLEQLRGDRDLDARADVYAFGVMLFELVTGQKPYAATNLAELALKVATTDAPRVATLRPDLPVGLANAIDAALARQREQRQPDVQTFQRQLAPFAESGSFRRAAADRVLLGAATALPVAAKKTWLPTQVLTRTSNQGLQRALWGALWLGIAGLLLAIGYEMVREQQDEASSAAIEGVETSASSAVTAAPEVKPASAAPEVTPAAVAREVRAATDPSPQVSPVAPPEAPELTPPPPAAIVPERKITKARPRTNNSGEPAVKAQPAEIAPPTPKPKTHQEVLGF